MVDLKKVIRKKLKDYLKKGKDAIRKRIKKTN